MSVASGITEISLSRGVCFGHCPSYRVTLRRDGSLRWFGDAFVDRLGHHAARFSSEEFEQLAEFVVRAGFFSWDDEYLPLATCSPSYQLRVVTVDGTKTVDQDGSNPEPADFWVVAALVDWITNRADWRPTA